MKRRAITQSQTMSILIVAILALAFYAVTSPTVHNQSTSSTASTATTQTTTSTATSTTVCSGALCGAYGTATGIIIPLYQGVNSPNLVSFVSQLITLRGQFPSVPMAVIINPSSGVGTYSATMATHGLNLWRMHRNLRLRLRLDGLLRDWRCLCDGRQSVSDFDGHRTKHERLQVVVQRLGNLL